MNNEEVHVMKSLIKDAVKDAIREEHLEEHEVRIPPYLKPGEPVMTWDDENENLN